jgi:hypothetical protein
MRTVSVRAAAVAGLLLAVLVPAQAATAGTVRAARPWAAADPASIHIPYTDPAQNGLITLCNKNNQPVTQGSITTKPFIWRAVSSVAAPSGYAVKNATATLYAYQPRPYTPAGAWSGLELSAGSVYTNPAHPMAQLTPIDQPLSYMTESFPPIWDGLIELRMYLSAPGSADYSTTYPVADLLIKGNTWTLAEGGDASCTTGSAVSREVILGLPGASGKAGSANGNAAQGASGSAAQAAGTSGSSASGQTSATASGSDSGSGLGAIIGFSALGLVLVLGGAGGGLWWRRRRRGAPEPEEEATASP